MVKSIHILLVTLLCLLSNHILGDTSNVVPQIIISDLEKEVEQARQKLEAVRNSYLKQVEQAELEYQWELKNQRLRAAKYYKEAGQSKAKGLELENARQKQIEQAELEYQWELQNKKRRSEELARKKNEQLADLEYQWELENQRLRAAKLYREAGKSRAMALEQEAARQAFIETSKKIEKVNTYQAIKYEMPQQNSTEKNKIELDKQQAEAMKRIDKTIADAKKTKHYQKSYTSHLKRSEKERLNRQEGEGTDNPPRQIPYKKAEMAPVQVLKKVNPVEDKAARKKQIQSYIQYGTTRNESLKEKQKEEKRIEKERLDLLQKQAMKRIDKTMNDAKAIKAYKEYGRSRSQQAPSSQHKKVPFDKDKSRIGQKDSAIISTPPALMKNTDSKSSDRIATNSDLSLQKADFDREQAEAMERIDKTIRDAEQVRAVKKTDERIQGASQNREIITSVEDSTIEQADSQGIKPNEAELDRQQAEAMERINKTIRDAEQVRAVKKTDERTQRASQNREIITSVEDSTIEQVDSQGIKPNEAELDRQQAEAMERINKTIGDVEQEKAMARIDQRIQGANQKTDLAISVKDNSVKQADAQGINRVIANPGLEPNQDELDRQQANAMERIDKTIGDVEQAKVMAKIDRGIQDAKEKRVPATSNKSTSRYGEVKSEEKKPLELSDLLIKPHADFDVLPNKRNSKQIRIKTTDKDINVRILGERGNMYLVAVYDGNQPRPGTYLISKKWAHKSLNIQAALTAIEIGKVSKQVGVPPIPECHNLADIPGAKALNKGDIARREPQAIAETSSKNFKAGCQVLARPLKEQDAESLAQCAQSIKKSITTKAARDVHGHINRDKMVCQMYKNLRPEEQHFAGMVFTSAGETGIITTDKKTVNPKYQESLFVMLNIDNRVRQLRKDQKDTNLNALDISTIHKQYSMYNESIFNKSYRSFFEPKNTSYNKAIKHSINAYIQFKSGDGLAKLEPKEESKRISNYFNPHGMTKLKEIKDKQRRARERAKVIRLIEEGKIPANYPKNRIAPSWDFSDLEMVTDLSYNNVNVRNKGPYMHIFYQNKTGYIGHGGNKVYKGKRLKYNWKERRNKCSN